MIHSKESLHSSVEKTSVEEEALRQNKSTKSNLKKKKAKHVLKKL